MLNLRKIFKSEEQPEGLELTTPTNAKAHFILNYKDLSIGYLNYSNGMWIFEYSDEFKHQDKIDVLVDFQEKNKKYEAKYLWPFFAHRIPGLGQPQILEIIKHEKLDAKNEIVLLKRFGGKTITNPFELTSA
ncbi:MAG TPA: HipA N-terminal domain-containing protein [Bacteroidia bacterium]|nr:HipA N-terminal domain-containing protein [Bacteroidia bacterium]